MSDKITGIEAAAAGTIVLQFLSCRGGDGLPFHLCRFGMKSAKLILASRRKLSSMLSHCVKFLRAWSSAEIVLGEISVLLRTVAAMTIAPAKPFKI